MNISLGVSDQWTNGLTHGRTDKTAFSDARMHLKRKKEKQMKRERRKRKRQRSLALRTHQQPVKNHFEKQLGAGSAVLSRNQVQIY